MCVGVVNKYRTYIEGREVKGWFFIRGRALKGCCGKEGGIDLDNRKEGHDDTHDS